MAVRHETELSQPVKQLFESMGYEVKSEVLNCDLVASRGDLEDPVIIELKKSMSVALLLQGMQRQRISPNVYIAVEKRKKPRKEWKQTIELCQRLGLGLITVQFFKTLKPRVEVCCDPGGPPETLPSAARSRSLQRRRSARLMKEFHGRSGDYNIGGSTRRKIVTAYREQSLFCAYLTEKHGIVTPKQLKQLSGFDQADRMLQRNVYGWFERIERGKYALTDAGKEALTIYQDIVKERFEPLEK